MTLVFPAAFVAVEFLKSRVTPAATWGSIAYTQYGDLPIMQIAALVGPWGVGCAIAWFASTAEWAWSRGFEWDSVRTPVLLCAGVLGTIVLAGAIRVALAGTGRSSPPMETLHHPPH